MSKPQKVANKVRLDNPTKLLPELGEENCNYRECYIAKIKHILPLVDQPPFVVWVSGNMMLYPPYKRFLPGGEQFTNGLWKDSLDPRTNRSIYQLAKISRPTNKQLEDQEKEFGYHMEWPPPLVGRWMPNSMKYFTKMKEKGEYEDILFFQAVGVVDARSGVYLREYGQAIAGYFIMKIQEGAAKVRKEFIDSQPLWYRKQYIVGYANYISHQTRIIRRGEKMIQRASRELPYHEVYAQSLPELMTDLPKSILSVIEQSGVYKETGTITQ
jgi:hypothetical protein